ncbi:MAG TPA: hypothetical protein VEB18_02155 [Candidatus Paceibacterota bacterium]|nr:hypothetical protein [Candidatus Paceibacterota bacterium]
MEEKIQRLREWIRATLPEGRGALIPVSGGTDSSLAFWLYATTVPERTLGVYFGNDLRQKEWFQSIGTFEILERPTADNVEIARWTTLLERSLKEHRVLIGTRNRTEDALGIYSAASRLAVHQPLIGLFKADVIALCEHIGVPEEIIASSKEADPECGRPEELARISFTAADTFAQEKLGLVPQGTAALDPEQREYLESLYTKNEFKKHLPLRGPEL